MPCPAENQSVPGHHLAIGAADLVILAVIGVEADPETTAGTNVQFGARRAIHNVRRPEPADKFPGVRPYGINTGRWRLKSAPERQFGPPGRIADGGHGFPPE